MGSWADLTISKATLEGYDSDGFYDPEVQDVTTGIVTTNALARAKREIVQGFVSSMPAEMVKFDTTDDFMDVLADTAVLDNLMQDVLVATWAARYYANSSLDMETGSTRFNRVRQAQRDAAAALQSIVAYLAHSSDLYDAMATAAGEDVNTVGGIYVIG